MKSNKPFTKWMDAIKKGEARPIGWSGKPVMLQNLKGELFNCPFCGTRAEILPNDEGKIIIDCGAVIWSKDLGKENKMEIDENVATVPSVPKGNKTIYDLLLHETIKVNGVGLVTRVPGGWIYSNASENCITDVFVPYHKEFKPEVTW